MSDETKIIRIIVDSSKAVEGSSAATRALQNLEKQAGSMDSTLAKIEKSLASVGGMMKAGFALAIAEAGAMLFELGRKAFEAAAGLGELAEQVGLTAREFQGLQFSAVQNGLKLEQLETGVSKFSKKIGDAATGHKEMIASLDRLGVKILDVNGKLRPTADLMQETAQKIGEIDDPAKKAAAAVEFFGKSGQKMLTMLTDISKGLFATSDAAEKFGAMISDHTIKRLDDIADGMERAKLKTRAFLAEGMVALLDWLDSSGITKALEFLKDGLAATFKFPVLLANGPQLGDFVDSIRSGFDKLLLAGVRFGAAMAEQFKIVWEFLDRNGLGVVIDAMQRGFESLVKTAWTLAEPLRGAVDTAKEAFDQMMIAGARFGAAFIETFKAIPAQLGQLFRDAVNNVLMALESGLPMITGAMEKYAPWLGVKTSTINLGRMEAGGNSGFVDGATDYLKRVAGAADQAEKAARATGIGRDYARERATVRQGDADRQRAEAEMLAANDPKGFSSAPSKGVSNPPPRGDGESEAAKTKKLIATLTEAAKAQDLMTEASRQGSVQFQEMQSHLEAQQKALEIWGGKLDATNPKVRALADQLEVLIKRDKEGKAATAFNVATTELAKQNVLLEAQNRLMNEAPEVQAKEIALIKARQEQEKAGAQSSAADFERRRQAVEQGELLKKQAEELKQSAERWTTPWKNAFQSIQQAGADAWEKILQGGRLSFESVADVARTALRRVAAELLNLATIRPLIGFGVQALGSVGILSPATVSSMGFGSSLFGSVGSGVAAGAASGVAAGAVGGSSGSGGLLSGLGLGAGGYGLFSGGSTGGGLFGGIGSWLNTPIGGSLGMSAAEIAAMGPAGQGLQGLTASPGLFGGLTPMGAIGGLAGMGFGIYNLATAKTPMGALGGGLGLIGGGLGLAAGAGLIGSAFGPIGMGIGLLGGLLGLFGGGEGEKKLPPLSGANTTFAFSGGRYNVTGSTQNGGLPITNSGKAMASSVSALFDLARGTPVEGKVWGGAQWVNQRDNTGNGYLVDPEGNSTNLGNNSDAKAISDLVIAAVFKANVLNGGLTGISETLKKVESLTQVQTPEGVQNDIKMTGVYDDLVKGDKLTQAEKALRSINDSFAEVTRWAKDLGLSVAPLEEAKAKQLRQVGEDFQHTIDAALDPVGTAMADFVKQREADARELDYINDNIKGITIDRAKFEEYEAKKEADLKKQLYGNAVDSLQQLIDQLTYGDLANVSPTTTLDALQGTFRATLAQSRGGDAAAIARLAGEGSNYATVARQNFASSPEYQAIVEEIRTSLAEVQAAIQQPGAGSAPLAANSPEAQQMLAGNEALRQIVQTQSAQIEDLRNMVASLVAQVQRVAVNGR